MTTKKGYVMTLIWNSGKSKLEIPVLPDKITVKESSKNNSVTIQELGEIVEKGVPSAKEYSFESIFPKRKFGAVRTNKLRKPSYYRDKIIKLKNNQTQVILSISGVGIFTSCLIVDFTWYEEGLDKGTLHYSMRLMEYKSPKVRTLRKTSKSKSHSRSTSKSKSKTYKVKKGDTLQKIAIKKCKNSSKWTSIWSLNKTVIVSAAKKKGKKATKSKPYLVEGTVLRLP